MPRLFICHSSKDSIQALAFHHWLVAKGWAEEDVFIDLLNMGASESWRDTLVKANVSCESLLYLVSPDSLASEECGIEVGRAEDDRKELIVAILHGVKTDDPRLQRFADRQIVDLSAEPRDERVQVSHKGRKYDIDFNKSTLNAIHAKLIEWGIAPDSFAWPPKDNPKAAPYPGLDAFNEHSAGIFFGREADIMAGIRDMRQIRHRGSPRLLVIQAASGAGKSSFLRGGLWPKLGRTLEFLPLCIIRPAKGIVTGQYGIGHGLARWFTTHKRQKSAKEFQAELMRGDAADGAVRLSSYLADAVALAAENQELGATDDRISSPLSPLIAIDQGEELFASENAGECSRFLEMMGLMLSSPPDGLDPYVIVTIRADSADTLLQRVPALGIDTPHVMALPPLSPAAYRDVIAKPAAVYTRQIHRLDIEPGLVESLASDATGADALPLLAFTLQRLFVDYAHEQKLTLAQYEAMGGIAGSISHKLSDALEEAGPVGTSENLRRLIVPGLATWDPAAGAAKRLVANMEEVTGGDRADLAPLAKSLVNARLLTRSRDTIEVAHEALLRRPPINQWLDDLKDALKLRDDVIREAKDWVSAGKIADSLVRRGERLQSALTLLDNPDFAVVLAPARDYLGACRSQDLATRRGARRTRAAIFTLMLGVIATLIGIIYKEPLNRMWFEYTTVREYVAQNFQNYILTSKAEQGLKAGDVFRECAKDCPMMVVVPSGAFWMGSETPDVEAQNTERPRHKVTIARPFAVSKFEVTWDEWDACVAHKGCDGTPTLDQGYGMGTRPVINVSWDQAKAYAAWLSRMSGRQYRLLSEAEWEYAARGVTSTDATYPIFPWGNTASHEFANYGKDQCCEGMVEGRDQWRTTSPVGQFASNAFGLYDMQGNVWEWVEDPWHDSYAGKPPTDGTPWYQDGAVGRRVIRSGSWGFPSDNLRSSARTGGTAGGRNKYLGIRVARTLTEILP